jgi:hypothetical protein
LNLSLVKDRRDDRGDEKESHTVAAVGFGRFGAGRSRRGFFGGAACWATVHVDLFVWGGSGVFWDGVCAEAESAKLRRDRDHVTFSDAKSGRLWNGLDGPGVRLFSA